MIDFRKILVALAIAVLFAIFVNTSIEAISPSPQYDDFCNESMTGKNPYRYAEPTTSPLTEEEKLTIDTYEQKNRECQDAWQAAQEKHQFVVFLVSAIAGLIAIIAGLYISVSTPVGMSIASGFILDGLFALFFGTISGWGSIAKTVRPFVMLVELIIVIFVAYKQLNKPMSLTTSAKKKR
jgi:uncharacterized membrane protein